MKDSKLKKLFDKSFEDQVMYGESYINMDELHEARKEYQNEMKEEVAGIRSEISIYLMDIGVPESEIENCLNYLDSKCIFIRK